jgi:hypothetical protein
VNRLPTSTIILAVSAVVLTLLAARGPAGGVTKVRLESAVAPTFANLVALQVTKIGAPPLDAATLRAIAHCSRVGAPRESRGAGDWTCDLEWIVPSRRTLLHDRYDLHVTPDGCYAASADGEEAHVGGPMLTTHQGGRTKNLLYAFEGCLGAP